ncbi:MAG: A24 family peptidase [Clostridiales bacterium]|nr:A24 family peptidase [Clostridiales bacterium]
MHVYVTLVILFISVVEDLCTDRIPNHWICTGFAAGVFLLILPWTTIGCTGFLTGLLIPFLIGWIPFRMGAIGAGDVKLLLVVGCLNGGRDVFYCIFLSFLFAAGISLGKLLSLRQFKSSLMLCFQFFQSIFLQKKMELYPERHRKGHTIHFSIAVFFGYAAWWGGEHMQEHVIFLGGFELAYMQKLALYFNSRLSHDTRVEIMNVLSEPLAPEGNTVWIGSEHFIGEVRQRREEASCVVLAEDVSEDVSHVFRYQPCEKLYQKVMFRYRQMQGFPVVSVDDIRQTWFVITTDAAPSSLLAFSVTFAQILGERGGVLYLNLSECSGMEDVFLLERGMDLTDAAVELRKDGEVCLDACIRRLEQMDYIMPPVNPMILHELREREVQRLIRAVKQKREYAYVVVALGSSCCGCEFFSVPLRESSILPVRVIFPRAAERTGSDLFVYVSERSRLR